MFGFKSKQEANALSHLAKSLVTSTPDGTGVGVGGLGGGINFSTSGILCQTDSAIPARSGATAGKGDDVKVMFIDNDGTITDTGNVITVYNPFGSDVAADTYVTCKFCRGFWVVDAEDC